MATITCQSVPPFSKQSYDENTSVSLQLRNEQIRLKSNKRIIFSNSKVKSNSLANKKCFTFASTQANQQINQNQSQSRDSRNKKNNQHIRKTNESDFRCQPVSRTTNADLQNIKVNKDKVNKFYTTNGLEYSKSNRRQYNAVYTDLYNSQKCQQEILNLYTNSNKNTIAYLNRKQYKSVKKERYNHNHDFSENIICNSSIESKNNIIKNNTEKNESGTFTVAYMGTITNINLNFNTNALVTNNQINHLHTHPYNHYQTNRQAQHNSPTNRYTVIYTDKSKTKNGRRNAETTRYTSVSRNRKTVGIAATSKQTQQKKQGKVNNILFNNKAIQNSLKHDSSTNYIDKRVQILKSFYIDKPQMKIKQMKKNKYINSTNYKLKCHKNIGNQKKNKPFINPNLFNIYRPATSQMFILDMQSKNTIY